MARHHRSLDPSTTDPDAQSPRMVTGTTTVALRADDGVVLAADRRTSAAGRFIVAKSTEKIEAIHPTGALAFSGAVSGLQAVARTLRSEVALYDRRRRSPMSMRALSRVASARLRAEPLEVQAILGGIDADGPHVYELDPAGGVLASPYAAGGSGMQVAYGVLEADHESELPVAEATRLAKRAVRSANARDAASGDGITVATVTSDGVTIEQVGDGEAGD